MVLSSGVLTLFILMDVLKHIDTISMGYSNFCFKGSQVEISKLICVNVPNVCFNLANSVNPDEIMWHFILVIT